MSRRSGEECPVSVFTGNTLEEVLALVPPEWHSALNQNPHCFTTRLALSDFMEDRGDELGAECLRYTVDRGWSPQMNTDHGSVTYGWYYWRLSAAEKGRIITPTLIDKFGFLYNFGPCDLSRSPTACFAFLIYGWRKSTPEERAGYWAWTPTPDPDLED